MPKADKNRKWKIIMPLKPLLKILREKKIRAYDVRRKRGSKRTTQIWVWSQNQKEMEKVESAVRRFQEKTGFRFRRRRNFFGNEKLYGYVLRKKDGLRG